MHFSSALLALASVFIVGSSALNMFVYPSFSPSPQNYSLHCLLSLTHFNIQGADSRRPREAVPEPAGCTGGSYRATTSAAAASECTAGGCHSCMTPFLNQGYYYAICECNVSKSVDMMR